MSKKWSLVGTNAINFDNLETKQERNRRMHRFNMAIRKMEQQNKTTSSSHKDSKEK